MEWRDRLVEFCPSCGQHIQEVLKIAIELQPNDAAGWIKLSGSIIGLFWLIWKMKKALEIDEDRFERYLEEHLDPNRKDLAAERRSTLEHFDASSTKSSWRFCWELAAGLWKHALYRLGRMLLIVRPKAVLELSIEKFNRGDLTSAIRYLEKEACDLLEKAQIYEEQGAAKRMAAANRRLYAGRLAAMNGDRDTARKHFKLMLGQDRCDTDALREMGKELLSSGLFGEALSKFEEMERVAQLSLQDRPVLAESLRLKADVYLAMNSAGRARSELYRSLKIEEELGNSGARAAIHEQLARVQMAFSPPLNRAAKRAYRRSIEQYRIAGNSEGELRVEKALAVLGGSAQSFETWGSRLLSWVGNLMLKAANKLRVPNHTPV